MLFSQARYIVLVLCLLIATSGISIYSTILIASRPARASASEVLECGSTSEEAIARGCYMEPMLYSWIRPECYVEEVSRDYPVFTDREWYRDDSYEVRVTEEELLTGKYPEVVTHVYHGEHCTFLWHTVHSFWTPRCSKLTMRIIARQRSYFMAKMPRTVQNTCT